MHKLNGDSFGNLGIRLLTQSPRQEEQAEKQSKSPVWLNLLIMSLVAIGIYFRFADLSARAYWHDETYTLLRISGYRMSELTHQLFNGAVSGVDQLLQFQQVNAEKGVLDTIRSLAIEDQPHTPIYFLLTRFWVQWLGNSIVVTRSLSALLSVSALPCMYWLCLELFESRLAAWLGVGLLAVSPFQVYYAQEVRAYSLWTVMILLMNIALLRAMRRNTRRAWAWYAIVLALALYSHIFSGITAFLQVVYVVVIERFRLTRRVISCVVASLVALLLFSPWIIALVSNLSTAQNSTAWMKQSLPIQELVKTWLFSFQAIFLKSYFIPERLKASLAFAVVVLIGYSLYCLCQKTPLRVWLLVLLSIIPISLGFMLPDLILGGRRSTNERYFVSCYLGCQLAVTYFLASQLASLKWQKSPWKVITIALFAAGVFSCAIQLERSHQSDNKVVAKIVNESVQPLIVSSEVSYQGGGTVGDILALSHLLDSKVKLQLAIEPASLKITDRAQNVFLYKPSNALSQQLEKTAKLEQLHASGLWRLVKPATETPSNLRSLGK